MIAIIDYGMGNLRSVSKAVERLGFDYTITSQAEDLLAAQALILPGVGAFNDAMKQLRELGLDQLIKQLVGEGKPILGICLGMQLLYSSSAEGGYTEGLNLLKGHISKLPNVDQEGRLYKVPHMGWNDLIFEQTGQGSPQVVSDKYVYFVHSYYATQTRAEEIIAKAHYGVEIPAIVGRQHILGMQFHPEKSGTTGLLLLERFCQQSRGE